MAGIATELASFVEKTTFNELPEHLVDQMKLLVLDAIGCAVRGHSTDCGRISAELARKLGGNAGSTIMGTPDKVAATNAAFANGQLISALDYHPMGTSHDAPAIAAAALSMLEMTQNTGKDLILSILLGLEITRRITYAAEFQGISSSIFGATVSAGKLLHLNQEKLANAIGLAGFITIPDTLMKYISTHPSQMVKYGPTGWIAQAGVTAALLADMGFTGDTDLFEGEKNYWRFTGKTKSNASGVTANLGKQWETHVEFKLYPGGI